MAIYHFCAKIGKRSIGQNAVASASYRSGEKLHNEAEHKYHDYTRKQGVVYTEIMLSENAPEEYSSREKLWNAVENSEKPQNAQVFREFEISLPNECTRAEQIRMTREFAQILQKEGMCVDIAIHDVKKGQYTTHGKATADNCHAHIMCTMRAIDENGHWLPKAKKEYLLDSEGNRIPVLDKNGKQKKEKNGKKLWKTRKVDTTDWDSQVKLVEWRKTWANIINEYLPDQEKVSEKTLEAQIEDMEKQLHEIEQETSQNKILSNASKSPVIDFEPSVHTEQPAPDFERLAKKQKLSPADLNALKAYAQGKDPQQVARMMEKYGFRKMTISIVTGEKPVAQSTIKTKRWKH